MQFLVTLLTAVNYDEFIYTNTITNSEIEARNAFGLFL